MYQEENDPIIAYALQEIEDKYGTTVSVNRKKKSLIKFGRNASVGTGGASIMQLQGSETHETYATSNSIDKIVTDDSGYTGTVTIEGHTISGSDLTFVTQTATLTGQTAVTLGTPLARANRIVYNSTDQLASSKKIYVYEDVATTSGVPNTAANTKLILDAAYGKSQKCSTSISSVDYWIITKVYGGILKKQAASVNIELQVRKVGFPWQVEFELPVSTDGSGWFSIDAPPAFIVPPNTDVRMVAISSVAGTEAIAGIAGYLAKA